MSGVGREGAAPRGHVEGDLDDESLMRAYCAGSERAFTLPFDRYAGSVRGFILRLTGDAGLASDITQTTFLSVIGARARFHEQSRFRPWVFTIAMNALRDHRRRTRREQLTDDGVPNAGVVDRPSPDPVLDLLVRNALACLPEDQRDAVVLHHVAGFSFGEIASMVGATESAVKVRAHRGYARMRELTRALWNGET